MLCDVIQVAEEIAQKLLRSRLLPVRIPSHFEGESGGKAAEAN